MKRRKSLWALACRFRPGSSNSSRQAAVLVFQLEAREVRQEREEVHEPLGALVERHRDPVPVVPDPDVEDGALVQRRRVVRIRVREVELDPELPVLVPVLEHVVADADRGRLQLRLEMLVVQVALEVVEIGAHQRDERQERAVGVVELVRVLAAPADVGDRDAALHGAVVVEVDERGQQPLEVLLDDLVLEARVEPAVEVDQEVGDHRRLDVQTLEHRPQLFDRVDGHRALSDLFRQSGLDDQVPHERSLVDFEVPHARVVVVLADRHERRRHHARPVLRFDLADLLVVEPELGPDDDCGVGLVPAPVLDVPLARVVLEVEVAARPLDGVQLLQRRQEGGLAGLVLAHQAGDVVNVDPARVVDASIVGYSRTR